MPTAFADNINGLLAHFVVCQRPLLFYDICLFCCCLYYYFYFNILSKKWLEI